MFNHLNANCTNSHCRRYCHCNVPVIVFFLENLQNHILLYCTLALIVFFLPCHLFYLYFRYFCCHLPKSSNFFLLNWSNDSFFFLWNILHVAMNILVVGTLLLNVMSIFCPYCSTYSPWPHNKIVGLIHAKQTPNNVSCTGLNYHQETNFCYLFTDILQKLLAFNLCHQCCTMHICLISSL